MRSRNVVLVALATLALVLSVVAYSFSVPPPPGKVVSYEIVVREIESGNETVIAGGVEIAHFPRFLLDGSVVFDARAPAGEGLWRVIPGSDPVLLWEGGAGGLEPSPSPNGMEFVFNGPGISLIVYNMSTAQFASFENLSPATADLHPVFHPDGHRVLFTWSDNVADGWRPGYLGTLDVESGAVAVLLRIPEPPDTIRGAFFLPDGEHIVFDMDGLNLFDLRLGQTFRLTSWDDASFPRASGSGNLVVLQTWAAPPAGPRTYGVDLYWLDSGRRVTVLSPTGPVQPWPDIDASGQRIVYVRGVLG